MLLILRSEFLPSNFSDNLDISNALDITFSVFFLATSHTLWILRSAFFRSNFSHALDITLCISSRNLYYAHNIIFYIIPNNLKPILDGFLPDYIPDLFKFIYQNSIVHWNSIN